MILANRFIYFLCQVQCMVHGGFYFFSFTYEIQIVVVQNLVKIKKRIGEKKRYLASASKNQRTFFLLLGEKKEDILVKKINICHIIIEDHINNVIDYVLYFVEECI